MPRRIKVDDSESEADFSEGDIYELQPDAYYDTKGCAPLTHKNRDRNRANRRDLQKEADKLNKMLEE